MLQNNGDNNALETEVSPCIGRLKLLRCMVICWKG